MKYVIKANKNLCGSVSGMWCIGPDASFVNWVRFEQMKADTGMDLNKAYRVLEETVKPHLDYKCGCDFVVEEAFDGWKIIK